MRCPSNGRSASSTSGLLAPAAQSSAGRAACSCLLWPAVLPRRPHRPILLPPLAGPAATAASHRSRTSEPSYSSPRGHPLPRLRRLRVVPLLGLAVIHHLGALDAAWSMWSTTDFHRKITMRGDTDSWVHGCSKEVLLITRKIIIPPPDSGDPPEGPLYFAKNVPPADRSDRPAIFARKEVPPYYAENNYSST